MCLVGIVLVIFQSGAVSARQGVFVRDYVGYNATQVLTIDRPEIARTFYGELKALGHPALYSFKGSKGLFVSAKIRIPRLEEAQDFRPALALFGPGLPKPGPDQLDKLPFSLPPDAGMVISETPVSPNTPPAPLTDFNEPFTQSDYWQGQELLRELPQDGTYYLAVFSRVGQGGKYALEVGDKDDAGVKEILGFPILWTRVHLWFGDWLTIVIVWEALGLLVLYGFYRLIRPALRLRHKFKPVNVTEPANSQEPVVSSTFPPTSALNEVSGEKISRYTPAPKAKPETGPDDNNTSEPKSDSID